MAVLDTSILIPLFDRGHASHGVAAATAREHRIWHVTGGVLAEFTQGMRRVAREHGLDANKTAREALERLESTASYRALTTYDAQLVSHIYHEYSGLSFIDAWGIGVALDRREPLLTLDEDQARILERLS